LVGRILIATGSKLFQAILNSNASQLATIWADPGYGVTADTPLVFLHTGKTYLETAVASPAEFVLFAATITEILLPFFPSQLYCSFHHCK
jgi:hypothetical protein